MGVTNSRGAWVQSRWSWVAGRGQLVDPQKREEYK